MYAQGFPASIAGLALKCRARHSSDAGCSHGRRAAIVVVQISTHAVGAPLGVVVATIVATLGPSGTSPRLSNCSSHFERGERGRR